MPKTRLLLETLYGGPAHGLADREPVTERLQVLAGPPEWYFDWRRPPQRWLSDNGGPVFEVTDFVRRLVEGDPDAVEALWANAADVVFLDPLLSPLLERRGYLLSTRVVQRYLRRAAALWQTVCERRSWLQDCPLLPTSREEFNATSPAPAQLFARLVHEHRYEHCRRQFLRCEAWQEGRSPAKARLEARIGFDGDVAMQALRHGRMAAEIARSAVVTVRRPDCVELLAIRDGTWSFDAVGCALRASVQDASISAGAGPLPAIPDESLASLLVSQILTRHLAEVAG